MGFAGVCGAPVFLVSLALKYVWVLGLLLLAAAALSLLYHLLADGPRRCLDVSWPLRFELSSEELEITRACSWRSHRIPASEVVGVHVYRQTVSYGRGPCGVGTSLLPTGYGDAEMLRRPEEVKADLVSPANCLGFLCGFRSSCSCAFLGAELQGQPRPLPLSRHVWHERGGLDELFDLATAVQRFKQGQLIVGDVGAYATQEEILRTRRAAASDPDKHATLLEAIAALPRRRLLPCRRLTSGDSSAEAEAPDLEACGAAAEEEETVECSICLQAMLGGEVVCTLPCGHVLHHDCAVSWLEIRGNCPLCKRHLQPGLQEPSYEALPEVTLSTASDVIEL